MNLLILATNTILSYMYYERIAIWLCYITPVVTFIGICIALHLSKTLCLSLVERNIRDIILAIGIAGAVIPIVLLIIVLTNVTH